MYQIKHISIKKVAIFSFIISFVGSFIFFIPFMLISSMISKVAGLSNLESRPELFPLQFFNFFIFIAPFFYAIVFTLMNSIITVFYHILAGKIGGLEINLVGIDRRTDSDEVKKNVDS